MPKWDENNRTEQPQELYNWHDYIQMSPAALALEYALNPRVEEHNDGSMKSTANTDVENKIINLDISQPPLKCALSYCYELQNLANAKNYQNIIQDAKNQKITKAEFIRGILMLEAEAAYFRCQIFHDFKIPEAEVPFDKAYLKIFAATKDMPKHEIIKQFYFHIEDNGIVRRQYPAKKYYADCYDFYSGKKPWPSHYDAPRDNETILLDTSPDDENTHRTPKPGH